MTPAHASQRFSSRLETSFFQSVKVVGGREPAQPEALLQNNTEPLQVRPELDEHSDAQVRGVQSLEVRGQSALDALALH